MTYEVPADRAERVAIHYKQLRSMAATMARGNSGRQAKVMHEEARIYQEVAQALLGTDEWNTLLKTTKRPDVDSYPQAPSET